MPYSPSMWTVSTTSRPNAWRWCSRFGLLVRTRELPEPEIAQDLAADAEVAAVHGIARAPALSPGEVAAEGALGRRPGGIHPGLQEPDSPHRSLRA